MNDDSTPPSGTTDETTGTDDEEESETDELGDRDEPRETDETGVRDEPRETDETGVGGETANAALPDETQEADTPDGMAESDQSDEAAGAENEAAGVENEAAGAENEAAGAENEAAGVENEAAGAENEAAGAENEDAGVENEGAGPVTPPDVRKYERFKKVDGAQYERVNAFLRDRTYITAREWAIARLCADFRTETGVEMTKIGENLPELVPFMEDTYSPQAVNQARSSFEDKVTKAGATFLYGAMCDFFTAEELDELMYEVTEVAKFLLEVEGVDLAVEDELEAEDRISSVMREVREASEALRYEECPHCGENLRE